MVAAAAAPAMVTLLREVDSRRPLLIFNTGFTPLFATAKPLPAVSRQTAKIAADLGKDGCWAECPIEGGGRVKVVCVSAMK